MSNTIPYIGSKISLVSNSEIRYEGILYTINTSESTIALQSVKTFGTEGRKIPEIPASSEIYDFIIFRGQDIKDLTVLEGAQNQSSAMFADPAIMSMNQRPSGGPGKDGQKGGGKDSGKGAAKGAASHDKGGSSGGNRGWEMPQPAKGGWEEPRAWWQGGKGARDDGWNTKGRSAWDDGGKGSGKGSGKWDDGKGHGAKGWDSWGTKGAGKGKDYGKGGKDAKGGGKSSSKGGKDDGKGFGGKGKGKGDGYGKGDSGKGKGGKGDRGGNRAKGGGKSGLTASGVPVGELLPEVNADVKKECADDFDLTAAGTKFEKASAADGEENAKVLSGYNKSSSFFDNISCEATDRAADVERPKVDREKARQYDKDTFGDTRRPPRPVGVRRMKGKGGGKGS